MAATKDTSPPNKTCFLRQTMITLADGKQYSFRALPYSKKHLPLIKILLGDGMPEEMLDTTLDAILVSLSYDQSPEEVEMITENGLIDLSDKTKFAEIAKALMLSFSAFITAPETPKKSDQ